MHAPASIRNFALFMAFLADMSFPSWDTHCNKEGRHQGFYFVQLGRMIQLLSTTCYVLIHNISFVNELMVLCFFLLTHSCANN